MKLNLEINPDDFDTKFCCFVIVLIGIVVCMVIICAIDSTYEKQLYQYRTQLVQKGFAEWVITDPNKPATFKLK